MKSVYTLLKLAGANLKVRVTSLMKRVLEACSWRSTVCEGGYVANDGERLLQALALLLMTMGMTVISLGQGPLLVSLFHMMRIAIMSVEAKARLLEV